LSEVDDKLIWKPIVIVFIQATIGVVFYNILDNLIHIILFMVYGIGLVPPKIGISC
jgi:hypothetical protein